MWRNARSRLFPTYRSQVPGDARGWDQLLSDRTPGNPPGCRYGSGRAPSPPLGRMASHDSSSTLACRRWTPRLVGYWEKRSMGPTFGEPHHSPRPSSAQRTSWADRRARPHYVRISTSRMASGEVAGASSQYSGRGATERRRRGRVPCSTADGTPGHQRTPCPPCLVLVGGSRLLDSDWAMVDRPARCRP